MTCRRATMGGLALIFLALTARDGWAEETRFVLVNGTNYPIRELVLSPHDLGAWSANVLRAPALKPGEARDVTFSSNFATCNQDLKVVFDDDASLAVWQYLNLCALKKIRLHFDRTSGITTASYEE
jgi:hypothetical protein